MRLPRPITLATSLIFVATFGECIPGLGATPPQTSPKTQPLCPAVEVVFCLDTTGSMGGLLESAKARIWGIINGLTGTLQGPRIKVGLVAFKDRGDVYVTQVMDLTDNLDAVQARLASFQASGGGDGPESVNQALADAMDKIHWSSPGARVYRTVFLVGDAPPHMDYKDDVKYPDSCRTAIRKGIVLNAIQCGGDPQAREAWTQIARQGLGGFAAIPQDGGVRVTTTPFDAWIADFSTRLLSTARYAGPEPRRTDLERGRSAALALVQSALNQKRTDILSREADLGEYRGRSAKARKGGLGFGAEASTADLVERYLDQGLEAFQHLRPEDLPLDLRALSQSELVAQIKALAFDRESLIRQLQDLTELRESALEREKKKRPERAFDDEVLELASRQAATACH